MNLANAIAEKYKIHSLQDVILIFKDTKIYNTNKLPLEKYLKLRLEDNETKFLKVLRYVAYEK